MPRYTDVEKLPEHMFSSVTHDRYVSDGRRKSDKEIYAYKVGYNEAIESIVRFAPTADVVEVVRCKDCKYAHMLTFENGIHCLSCSYQNAHGMLVENHGFCYWGERGTDDAEK